MIREPNRGDNLLDLVITDIESATTSCCTKIADHAVLFVTLSLSVPEHIEHRRAVWIYSCADWEGLEADIGGTDFSFLANGSSSAGAELMTKSVLEKVTNRIPQRMANCKQKSHPWLNDKIVDLVWKKHQANGTPEYQHAVRECSEGKMVELQRYAQQSRKRLLDARRGSKLWWTLSRAPLMQKTSMQGIPALRTE